MARPQEKRGLVVDDEPDVVLFLRTALEDAGFQAEPAFSVDEALERIRAHPPDCISLDMVMPRKSGIVLFHELRRNPNWSRIPVLFVTGHAREEAVRRDLDAAATLADSMLSGPATYLEKPVTAEKFVEAVAAVLHVDLGEACATPPGGRGGPPAGDSGPAPGCGTRDPRVNPEGPEGKERGITRRWTLSRGAV